MMVTSAPHIFAAASSNQAAPGMSPGLSRLQGQRHRRGFTLVEVAVMAAGVALLMGVAVSLSHSVRDRSSIELTRNILEQLERSAAAYTRQHHQPPAVTPLLGVAGDETDEAKVMANAVKNNREALRVMAFSGSELPVTVYDPVRKSVRDAWGTPIALVAGKNPRLGLSPDDRPYFVSAGPDRKFLTREDNLYGYEGASLPAESP
jgi:type II secretory pathway pseudopilin PulG